MGARFVLNMASIQRGRWMSRKVRKASTHSVLVDLCITDGHRASVDVHPATLHAIGQGQRALRFADPALWGSSRCENDIV